MPATIVFSDGSKQLAHNLDDLYERWKLKKEKSDLDLLDMSVPIPIARTQFSMERLTEWYLNLVSQKSNMGVESAQLRQVYKDKDCHYRTRKLLKQKRGVVRIAIAYCEAGIVYAQSVFRDNGLSKRGTEQVNLGELELSKQYSHYLRKLLYENDIDYMHFNEFSSYYLSNEPLTDEDMVAAQAVAQELG